jgi:hypothetical protein
MLQRKQSQEPTRHRPSKGLALAPINKGDKIIMTYKPCLKPWAIARLLPNQKWVIIGRYRSRNDADGHLQLCRLRVPKSPFKVVFDLIDSKK